VCKRKPNEVPDIPVIGGPVADDIRVWDKRSTKQMLQTGRELGSSDPGPIDDAKVAECLNKREGRTEVRKRAVAGRR
jgi:hypothetical protein